MDGEQKNISRLFENDCIIACMPESKVEKAQISLDFDMQHVREFLLLAVLGEGKLWCSQFNAWQL